MPATASVVDEKGSECILAHTGPRELDWHTLGGCGSGFGLVPGYTTLSVRVRANIQFGALKNKKCENEHGEKQHPVSQLPFRIKEILHFIRSS